MQGSSWIGWTAGGIAAAIVVAGVIQWVRPAARVERAAVGPAVSRVSGPAPRLPWPPGTQAAVDVEGVGWMGQHGPTTPLPIGSVTKLMTAWLTIRKHPLALGANGPSLTITPADAAAYQADVKGSQSVLPVKAGERLSERVLLEGLLVASGNNAAHLLAHWVAGSDATFVKMMNREARRLGLHHTRYAGPSGLGPQTVSTAADQVRLAEKIMANPVLAQISSMPQMLVPATGQLAYNYNHVLGQDGIFGVKTGSTVPGGASFIASAHRQAAGRTLTVYAGVVGQQPTPAANQLRQALDDCIHLVIAAGKAVHPVTALAAGQSVGRIVVPWQSATVRVVAKTAIPALGFGGLAISRSVVWSLPSLTHGLAAGSRVGKVVVRIGEQTFREPIVTQSPIAARPPLWRLTRNMFHL